MPKEHHSEWRGDNASCRAAEEKGHGGQGDGHDDSFSAPSHRSADEADSPRKDSDQSCFQSFKEEYEEVERTAPLTTRKKLTRKRFKGQNRVGQQHRSNRVPVLAPLKLLDGTSQRIASAHQRHNQQLSNEVWDLQRQLRTTVQENRLLQRLQCRHAAALLHFQDIQGSLPQLLHNHSSEVRALQELLRRAKTHINLLARKLRSTESALLHTRDTLQWLQCLSKDQNLEERETLTQRLTVLTVDLEKKNKRIQDLETNLALSTASFNRQMSSEMRKTMEARDLSRHLEELISNLMQKIKGMEKELANHDIYSHRFLKGSLKKGTKESKFVQTEPLSPIVLETPPLLMQTEYPQKDNEKKPWFHLQEFDASEPAKDRSSEDKLMQKDNEQTSNETPPATEETKLVQTEPLSSIAFETPPLSLQIKYPQKDIEKNAWGFDASKPAKDRSSEDELTHKEKEETSNETPPATEETKLVQTEPLSSIAFETPPLSLQIKYPQKDIEKNAWRFDASKPAKDRSSEDELTHKEKEETSNETPPDIGRTSGTDGIKLEYDAEQEEMTANLTQDLAFEGHNSQDNNDQLVITQSPSTKKATKSLGKNRQQYIFKETILNLHSGTPAYGTSQRSGPRFHRCNKPKATTTVLDTGTYDPSFFVPASTSSMKQEPQPIVRPSNTKKNNLMKELFGQVKLVEQMPDNKLDAGTKSSDPTNLRI
ncbi:lebercilin-like protein isoform X1 [Pangasianodon hypophthalmus]|uniref:lebercilin-like protein isoform X1 n=1 Tax=Pangasianodon hypophthalmus TaxID=310915 RepID=UPI0023082A6F|nr:lebercilin-like protein isoform X1 [Pangasianodon hypophthalmus]